ncbi:MAG: hypothetical protein MJZ17_00145 [Bacteroidales bacterium]|nr:hypothetical protein [Bacteroidales bacterium]
MSTIKASSILSVLAGAVVLLSSCDKENPQQYKYEATFYVGGNVAKDAAYIYKGNELLYRLDDNSTLSGLAVMEDGIYSCGEFWNLDANGKLQLSGPVIWKDGKRLDVDFGGTTGSIQNMVKSGKDWLCCGTITGDDGKNYGIIIENGKVVFRSGDPVSFDYLCLGASGDYYVLVTDLGSVELWRIDAETKQLVSSETIASQEGYDAWFGTCMYVGLRDIAVGMWKMNLLDGTYRSYIWLSGSKGLVDLQENSSIESLCFFNGYCLAGGSVYTEWNESGSPTSSKAVQWIVNDRTTAMQDFSIGCIGKSQLNLLMNYDDRFLFQGVRHDGGFQICQDGALLEEIKTPKGFNANAWEVTVEKVPVQ